MSDESIENVRAAITATRAGWENASDEQLRKLWRSMDSKARSEALKVAGENNGSHDQTQPESPAE